METAQATAAHIEARQSEGYWTLAWRRLLRNRLAVLGLILIGMLVVIAVFAPLIATHNPVKQDYNSISEAPGRAHWFGTDNLGRDAFSRVVYGAQTSLAVGLFTQIIVVCLGVPIGAIAGYVGHRTDNLIMRGVDVVYAFPDLLFIILLRSVLGGGLMNIFLAIGLVSWTTVARLVRGQVLATKDLDYVLAARALGAKRRWILARHLLPNIMGPIIVMVTFGIPRAIFIEASLSYIGIGVRPPTQSWGSMIQDGYSLIFTASHLVVFPTIAIAIVMLAFTFLGDGLRDALDPRATGRR